jgi:nitroimidazol reductase NimA-like FMN-containing flavoprotein (pyridoxamine 5'-phosphate oxidase superfamily)
MEEVAMTRDPLVELDPGFSAEDGRATPWPTALALLEKAEVFWLSTVRADGRPHVTPLVAVWLDEALYFCTGEGEQKEKNIQRNQHCVLTTGCNNFREGLDLVIEGDAVQVRDEARLHRLAGLWKSQYDWPYDVRDGVFRHPGSEGKVPVFEVAPTKAFAYSRGGNNSATRYRFNPGTS